MPEGQRPKIVVFGESLGSFGGEAPFLSPNNIIARTDGALFSGPTFSITRWTDVTTNGTRGHRSDLPIFDNGDYVRFSARPDNLDRPSTPWHNRGFCTFSTRPIHRLAESTCFSPNRDWLGRNHRAWTSHRTCSGFRSSPSCRCRPIWRWRSTFLTGTAIAM